MSNLFGGLLTRLHRLASTRCVWPIATGDSGCGIAPGCAAARSSSMSSLIPSFEDGSFHPSCVSRKCWRFRLYGVPCAVRMLYNLGVLALFVTLARSHVFRIGFRTRTVCCGDRGASSFAVRSWYDWYISCRCWRNAFTFPSDRDDMAGRFDLYLLPFRSSHGDGRLWSIGVVLRHNIAKWGAPPLSFAFVKSFFTVCTVLSMNPFDLGYSGELVTWSNPYLALKTRISSELYCGPLSEISLSGIPCSSKISLRWLMTVLELMFVSFRMIGNLLYKSAISIYSVQFQWNRSVARVCQECFGTSCGISVSFVLATWCAWHGAHALTISSMSWLIPHQKTAAFARSLHFSAPWCA